MNQKAPMPPTGTALFFGPPEGVKVDPRFPMPVSVLHGGATTHYVSRQEHTALCEEQVRLARAEAEAMLVVAMECLEFYASLPLTGDKAKRTIAKIGNIASRAKPEQGGGG